MSEIVPESELCFPVTPDPDDGRDHVYEHRRHFRVARGVSRSLPVKLDLRDGLNLPRSQGRRGTCVAFSCGAIKEWQERKDIGYQGYFSPDSLYFYRETKPGSGMFCRNAMKLLHEQGMTFESFFPYNKTEEPEAVPEKAIETMGNFKTREYAKVTTIDGLKDCLSKYGPCLISFPTYDVRPEFWRASSSEVERRGGHAVCVVGYNQDGFILRNSWGKDWNGDGHVLYPYSDWGHHWNLWSCVDAESEPLNPPNPGPDPTKRVLCCGLLSARQ